MRHFFVLMLLSFLTASAYPRVCSSTASGNWSDPAIWSCGTPCDGDTLVILLGHTVCISSSEVISGLSGMYVVVTGTLTFNTDQELAFPCNTAMELLLFGEVKCSSGGGNRISICNNVIWECPNGTIAGPITCDEAGCRSVLPVTLTSFTARAADTHVELNWTTLAELNNDYYTIERSTDAENYYAVGTVGGKGTCNTTSNYIFIDRTPLSGTSYYRLSQTDFDGKTVMYPAEAVHFQGSKGKIRIQPNPIKATASVLEVHGINEGEQCRLTIHDLNGRKIYQKASSGVAGRIAMPLTPPANLHSGLYVATLITEKEMVSELLLVD